MKKVIRLILVTLMVTMLLAGCSNSNEVVELRQEVENLQNEVVELRQEVENLQSELSQLKECETPEVKPSETTTKAVTSDMLDYLTMQLQSNRYADWDAVANCNYATEEHLLTAAKQCAEIWNSDYWAEKIATSICENPAVTAKVLKELVYSDYTSVTAMAHTRLEEMLR